MDLTIVEKELVNLGIIFALSLLTSLMIFNPKLKLKSRKQFYSHDHKFGKLILAVVLVLAAVPIFILVEKFNWELNIIPLILVTFFLVFFKEKES